MTHAYSSDAVGDLVLDAGEVDWIEAQDYYAAIRARDGARRLQVT